MMAAVGAGAPEAAYFHLLTHAFFKALLFLVAGSVLHALHTGDVLECFLDCARCIDRQFDAVIENSGYATTASSTFSFSDHYPRPWVGSLPISVASYPCWKGPDFESVSSIISTPPISRA